MCNKFIEIIKGLNTEQLKEMLAGLINTTVTDPTLSKADLENLQNQIATVSTEIASRA